MRWEMKQLEEAEDRPKRRSIKRDYRDWPRWERFMMMFAGADRAPFPEDSRKYATILFETGCRIAEVVKLERDMFAWNDEAIVCWHAPLLKKGEPATRRIYIKLDDRNPLGYALVDYLEACKTKYLLPGFKDRHNRTIDPDHHVCVKTCYNRITEMHKDLFPHILRGYRAGMLVTERGFDMRQLMAWFDWKSADMAAHYTRIKDIPESMGIKNIPLE